MTLQDRIDELVAQHGSLRAVARVTEIDVGYLSRLRAYANVNPGRDKLRRLGLRRVVAYEMLKTPNAANEAGQTARANDAEGPAMSDNKPLRRGVDGICTRSTCECEREGLGDQCVWLGPAEAEFECLGEPSLCTNPRGCACVPDSKTPNV